MEEEERKQNQRVDRQALSSVRIEHFQNAQPRFFLHCMLTICCICLIDCVGKDNGRERAKLA